MKPDGPVLDRSRFRLGYADCDPAGIVYFATYLPHAERLHSGWWFDRGLALDRHVEQTGVSIVTRHLEVDYTAAPRLHDEIDAELRLVGIGERSFRLLCTFRSAVDDRVFATLRLAMACVGPDGRPAALPTPVRRILEEAANR